MSNLINYNGHIQSAATPLLYPTNRAFLYGDGLFESIRMFDGKMPFFEKHCNRLLGGMVKLKMPRPSHFNYDFIEGEIKKLTLEQQNCRIRFTLFRKAGGLYTPQSEEVEFVITFEPMDQSRFQYNSKGLKIGIFDGERLPLRKWGKPKTCNALPYVLASIYKKKMGWDDCLLLNDKGRIAEASSSNIFTVSGKKLRMVKLEEGGVKGIMQSVILNYIMDNDYPIDLRIGKLSLKKLKNADEIFLTNAIQGIRWVEEFDGKKYDNQFSSALSKELNSKLLTYDFCSY